MQYNLYIETTQGMKNAMVDSPYVFFGAPFGYVPYRKAGSCELDQTIIDDFWRCVDIVLEQNELTADDFIRAVRAFGNSNMYGEINN